MQPYVTVLGNVATKPQQRETRQGQLLTQFRLAQTQRRRDFSGNWVDGATSWYDVTCWRGSHNVLKSIKKGDPVIVLGRLRINEWVKDGHRYRDAVIDATTVGPDLRLGVSTFAKVRREQPEQAADNDDYVFEMSRMADAEIMADRSGANGGSPGGTDDDPDGGDDKRDAGQDGAREAERQAA